MVDGESADSTSARASTTTAGAATTSAPASLGPPPSTSSSDAAPPPSAAAQADALLRQIGFFSGLLHRPTKAAARAGAGADRLPDELRLQVLEAVSATLGRALASGQFKPAEGQTGGSDDSSLQTEGDDLEACVRSTSLCRPRARRARRGRASAGRTDRTPAEPPTAPPCAVLPPSSARSHRRRLAALLLARLRRATRRLWRLRPRRPPLVRRPRDRPPTQGSSAASSRSSCPSLHSRPTDLRPRLRPRRSRPIRLPLRPPR